MRNLRDVMNDLESVENLPHDIKHHSLFFAAILIGKTEGEFGVPDCVFWSGEELILSWKGKVEVGIDITAEQHKFYVSLENNWWVPRLCTTTFEVMELMRERLSEREA